MFAKLINENEIEEAPSRKGGVFNYNLDEAAMKKDGFKPVEPDVLPLPSDMICPQVRYRDDGAVINQFYVDTYVAPPLPPEPTYAEKRAAEYPPIADYLDAQVKINSGDEILITQGNAQLQTYFQRCLSVKAKYPKPTEEQYNEN